MSKKRLYEIAKELGKESKEVVTRAKELGLEVKSHASSVEVAAAEKISITPEELAEELRNIALEEEEDPEEFVETLEDEDVENIADQLTMDKTMAFILDSVVYDN